jgi:hypothetical protein
VFAVANRVVRDGMPLDKPLNLERLARIPWSCTFDEAWNDPPPYAAKFPDDATAASFQRKVLKRSASLQFTNLVDHG